MEPVIVKYSKKIKRVSLQRFLITKIILEVDKIRERDLVTLYDNQLWLERKCLSDPDFNKKFGISLEELSVLLKEINFSQGLTISALKRLTPRIKQNLSQFLIPPRNYQSFKTRFDGHFHLHALKTKQESNKHLPPKRVIGIGYRDKGTARDPAFDGSPSWQEVASSAGQWLLAKENIRNAKSFKDIERVFKDLFGVSLDQEGEYSNSTEPPEEPQRKRSS